MTIAERLRASREELGWSKAHLRRTAKIKSSSTITELEDGTIKHSPQLPLIARALGVDALWLQTGNGQAKPAYRETVLTDDERAVVTFFRAAPPDLRAAMLRMVGVV